MKWQKQEILNIPKKHMNNPWKRRLYTAYISSGQAISLHANPVAILSQRRYYIQGIIRRHIPRDRHIRIVDLGCGYGAFLHYLQLAGYRNISGVDVSPEQIELAHRLGIESAKQQEMVTHLAELAGESINLILLIDVIEHLERQELFDMLDDVFRVLAPGGICIFHVPNASGLFGMHVRYGDITHESAFTPQSIWQLLSTIGFQQVQCFEEKPIVHGAISFARRLLWDMGTLPLRVLITAETGDHRSILSQNMLVTCVK